MKIVTIIIAALATAVHADVTYGVTATPAADAACDYGPNFHSHLIVPLTRDVGSCKKADSEFFLAHGATFYCPHTWDVKILATIEEDDARATLCDSWFKYERSGFPMHSFRPKLPQGGLPAAAQGRLTSWTSEVMYHIWTLGKDNSAGPDGGWNVTTIRDTTTTVRIKQTLYGQRLMVQPRPAALTYLVHHPDSMDTDRAILSHYITTSGDSGFDHILSVRLESRIGKLKLRSEWPLFLTVPARTDSIKDRIRSTDIINGLIHTYDDRNLPTTIPVTLVVELDYYVGQSDGFAGFQTMCPYGAPKPPSPSTCIDLA